MDTKGGFVSTGAFSSGFSCGALAPQPIALKFFGNNGFCQWFWELKTNNGCVHAGCKNSAPKGPSAMYNNGMEFFIF